MQASPNAVPKESLQAAARKAKSDAMFVELELQSSNAAAASAAAAAHAVAQQKLSAAVLAGGEEDDDVKDL